MIRKAIIDLATAEDQALCSKPCAVYAVRVHTALSAHAAQVNNGAAAAEIVDQHDASSSVGENLEFYGAVFEDGCYIRRTNAAATGKLLCFYEEVTL